MAEVGVKAKHFDKLMIESVRYCLGRMTYAVSECSQIVRQYWRHIGENAKQVIRRDIAKEIEKHNGMLDTERYRSQLEEGYSHFLGMECDAFVWIELLNWIEVQEKESE